MAFTFNLSPERVPLSSMQRDYSFLDTLQAKREDRKAGDAAAQAATGLDPDTARTVAPLLRNAQTREQGLQMVRDAMKPKEQPSGVREYEYAKSQGYQGSFADWEQSKRKAGANNTTINMGEGNAFYKKLDENNAQTFSDIYAAGNDAARAGQELDALGGLLETVPQGMGAAFKQKLGEWGINTEGLDDIQAATAVINRLIPSQRPKGSGPMSDRDIDMFKAGLPRIINQPGGNQLIMQTLRAINQYDRQMGDIAARVADRQITPQQARAEMSRLANPLAGFRVPDAPQGGQPQPQGQPVRVNTPEEARRLPKGTRFIDPNGVERVVP